MIRPQGIVAIEIRNLDADDVTKIFRIHTGRNITVEFDHDRGDCWICAYYEETDEDGNSEPIDIEQDEVEKVIKDWLLLNVDSLARDAVETRFHWYYDYDEGVYGGEVQIILQKREV